MDDLRAVSAAVAVAVAAAAAEEGLAQVDPSTTRSNRSTKRCGGPTTHESKSNPPDHRSPRTPAQSSNNQEVLSCQAPSSSAAHGRRSASSPERSRAGRTPARHRLHLAAAAHRRPPLPARGTALAAHRQRPHRRAGSRHARPSRSMHSSSFPRQHANPAGCNDRHRTAPARCGNRLGDPVRTRGRIHRAESLTDPGRRRRKLPQVDPIGTLLADRRNLHHNAAQYLALPNVGLHRFHRGRGSSWPADPGLRGRLPNPALFERRRDTQVAYRVLAGAVARSCVASLLFTSCAAVNVNPRASRPPCRPGIAAAQGGNG